MLDTIEDCLIKRCNKIRHLKRSYDCHGAHFGPALSYELLPLLGFNYFRKLVLLFVLISFQLVECRLDEARLLLKHLFFLFYTLACIHAEEVDE